MERRLSDPAINSHISFALILATGLDGIENNLPLPLAVNEDLCCVDEKILKNLAPLPDSLKKAIEVAKKS